MPKGGARPGTGPKKGSHFQATINRQLILEETRAYLASRAAEVNKAWVDKAARGEPALVKEFNDRLYDKAPQTLGGKDGAPLFQVIVQRFQDNQPPSEDKT